MINPRKWGDLGLYYPNPTDVVLEPTGNDNGQPGEGQTKQQLCKPDTDSSERQTKQQQEKSYADSPERQTNQQQSKPDTDISEKQTKQQQGKPYADSAERQTKQQQVKPNINSSERKSEDEQLDGENFKSDDHQVDEDSSDENNLSDDDELTESDIESAMIEPMLYYKMLRSAWYKKNRWQQTRKHVPPMKDESSQPYPQVLRQIQSQGGKIVTMVRDSDCAEKSEIAFFSVKDDEEVCATPFKVLKVDAKIIGLRVSHDQRYITVNSLKL